MSVHVCYLCPRSKPSESSLPSGILRQSRAAGLSAVRSPAAFCPDTCYENGGTGKHTSSAGHHGGKADRTHLCKGAARPPTKEFQNTGMVPLWCPGTFRFRVQHPFSRDRVLATGAKPVMVGGVRDSCTAPQKRETAPGHWKGSPLECPGTYLPSGGPPAVHAPPAGPAGDGPEPPGPLFPVLSAWTTDDGRAFFSEASPLPSVAPRPGVPRTT